MMRSTWIPQPLHRHAIPATPQQLKQRRRRSKALLLRMSGRFSHLSESHTEIVARTFTNKMFFSFVLQTKHGVAHLGFVLFNQNRSERFRVKQEPKRRWSEALSATEAARAALAPQAH